MKSKNKRWIVLAVVAIAVVAAGIWGKNYYDSRYVGEDYYTVIPQDYQVSPEAIYDSSGEQVGAGVDFSLIAYNEQGESKTVNFEVYEGKESIPQPGTYLKVSASEQIVVGWSVVEKNSIPEKALELIAGS